MTGKFGITRRKQSGKFDIMNCHFAHKTHLLDIHCNRVPFFCIFGYKQTHFNVKYFARYYSKVVFLGCPRSYFSRPVHRNKEDIFLFLAPKDVLLTFCTLEWYNGLIFVRKLAIFASNRTQK